MRTRSTIFVGSIFHPGDFLSLSNATPLARKRSFAHSPDFGLLYRHVGQCRLILAFHHRYVERGFKGRLVVTRERSSRVSRFELRDSQPPVGQKRDVYEYQRGIGEIRTKTACYFLLTLSRCPLRTNSNTSRSGRCGFSRCTRWSPCKFWSWSATISYGSRNVRSSRRTPAFGTAWHYSSAVSIPLPSRWSRSTLWGLAWWRRWASSPGTVWSSRRWTWSRSRSSSAWTVNRRTPGTCLSGVGTRPFCRRRHCLPKPRSPTRPGNTADKSPRVRIPSWLCVWWQHPTLWF